MLNVFQHVEVYMLKLNEQKSSAAVFWFLL